MLRTTDSLKSLNYWINRSWVIIGAFAGIAYLLIQVSLVSFEHRQESERIQSTLDLAIVPISSALFRELMDPKHSLMKEVIEELKLTYKVPVLTVTNVKGVCNSGKYDKCIPELDRYLLTTLAFGNNTIVLGMEKPRVKPVGIVLSGLPLLLVLLTGVVLQRRLITRSVIRPIQLVSENIGKNISLRADATWAREIVEIDEHLTSTMKKEAALASQAFDLRAEALINESKLLQETSNKATEALIAEGAYFVIHDVKRHLVNALNSIAGMNGLSAIQVRDITKHLEIPQRLTVESLSEFKRRRNGLAGESPTIQQEQLSSVGAVLQDLAIESAAIALKSKVKFRVQIAPASLTQFCNLSSLDLYRAISNLIDNAFNALKNSETKEIDFIVTSSSDECVCSIKDTGSGFTEDGLLQIQQGAIYSDTPSGNGLGYKSAKSLVGRCGGTIQPFRIGDATIITVRIPIVSAPKWFFNIRTIEDKDFAILDDDTEILSKLRSTLNPDVLANRAISVFNNETDFLSFVESNPETFLIIDYDYSGSRNGLDLIEHEHLEDRAVLVSGLIPFDTVIMDRASSLDLRLFPKSYLNRLEI